MTRALRVLSFALLLGATHTSHAQTVPPLLPPQGLTDPTLAFGVAGVSDWGTGRPFIDLMLSARPWFGAAGADWQTMSPQELVAGGYVDDEGWVIRMPPGIHTIRTIWAYPETAAAQRAGTYILTYEGEGSLTVAGDARRIDARPGRIVFQTEGRAFWLNIEQIDPRGVGRPIRNIKVIRDKDIPLYEAGVVFRPEWVDVIKDARVLRFMNWEWTNGSEVLPGETPLIEARGFWSMKLRGVPLSVMVELANLVGAEPWFCMPHQADDDYVRAHATYVRDTLDPALTVHVEYSNEVWNEAFPQARWVREQAASEWGIPYGNEGGFAFTTREATRDALIWEDVFGADATTRLNNVLATQVVNAWGTGILLDPVPWAKAEPDSYLPPSAVFDSLAVTTYFGSSVMGTEELRRELVRRVQVDPADARSWLTALLSDPTNQNTPAGNRANFSAMKELAKAHGLRLVGYEGGQHVHHAFAIPGLTEQDVQTVTDFMIAYVRGPEMADLTATNWDIWKEYGDGPYMHFGDVELASRWGSFALFDAPGVLNPTAELLIERNRTTPSWWGDGGGVRYTQGVLVEGNDRNNALSGTERADILIAGSGDDLVNPGPGRDHINGGEGIDTVILPDPPETVSFAPDGPRIVATGPSGRWHLFSVERLRFADGTELDSLAP